MSDGVQAGDAEGVAAAGVDVEVETEVEVEAVVEETETETEEDEEGEEGDAGAVSLSEVTSRAPAMRRRTAAASRRPWSLSQRKVMVTSMVEGASSY